MRPWALIALAVLLCSVTGCNDEEHASGLEWAEASWDGKLIRLRTRSSEPTVPVSALVTFDGGVEECISLVDNIAIMSWTDPKQTPFTVRFTQGPETLMVDVLDIRSPAELAKTPLPEVDPSLVAALREAFLLQRYGGSIVDPDSIPGLCGGHRPPLASTPAAYAVQAWLDGRVAFHVVDRWRAALVEAQFDPILFERVRLDGEELREVYARRTGPADGLVMEELGWRLNEEHDGPFPD